jgi:hypothetical protein
LITNSAVFLLSKIPTILNNPIDSFHKSIYEIIDKERGLS